MTEGTSNSQRDLVLLSLGAVLVASCIVIAHFAPATFQAAFLQMRVLTALGGALLGTALPGIIGIELKGIRAAGALSFVVLFFLFTPSLGAAPPERETSTQAATRAEALVPASVNSSNGSKEAAPNAAAPSYVNSPTCQGDNCNLETSYGNAR